MKFIVFLDKFFLVFIFLFFINSINSTPINNRYDPVSIYNIFGTDKYYYYHKNNKCFRVKLDITPFYQHSGGARDKDGVKVPEGDMLGRWNMLATLFGDGAVTLNKHFEFEDGAPGTPWGKPEQTTASDFPFLSIARRVFDGYGNNATEEAMFDTTHETVADWVKIYPNVVRDANVLIGAGTAAGTISKAYAFEANYDPADDNFGKYSIPIKYEKLGLRGRLGFDFGYGFGVAVKSGVVDIRQKPTFNDQTESSSSTIAQTNDKTLMKTYMTNQLPREHILGDALSKTSGTAGNFESNELNFKTSEYKKTVMEDTHIEFYWCLPFDVRDDEGESAVSFAPYFSFGVWAPSGQKQDQNWAFSIPSGSDGQTGFTVEGSINLDFLKNYQLGFGAGAAIYGSKDYKNYRVPSSIYQAGIYPWQTDIRRSVSPVWYVNLSLKAEEFIKNFFCSFEYIYTQKNKDSITLKETDATRLAAFVAGKGKETLEENSKWKNNIVQGGVGYKICPGIQLSLGFQAHISGVKVYRTTTVFGTLSLVI
ncbi:hypothetical protein K9L05_03350 [Candidatus Babeliales bacterium]|nr:hypothetical protein [Candidatus Babeliales bacterium]MCF7899656.1 hypothetical protein [Candidatus Babeliales bacterium]